MGTRAGARHPASHRDQCDRTCVPRVGMGRAHAAAVTADRGVSRPVPSMPRPFAHHLCSSIDEDYRAGPSCPYTPRWARPCEGTNVDSDTRVAVTRPGCADRDQSVTVPFAVVSRSVVRVLVNHSPVGVCSADVSGPFGQGARLGLARLSSHISRRNINCVEPPRGVSRETSFCSRQADQPPRYFGQLSHRTLLYKLGNLSAAFGPFLPSHNGMSGGMARRR